MFVMKMPRTGSRPFVLNLLGAALALAAACGESVADRDDGNTRDSSTSGVDDADGGVVHQGDGGVDESDASPGPTRDGGAGPVDHDGGTGSGDKDGGTGSGPGADAGMTPGSDAGMPSEDGGVGGTPGQTPQIPSPALPTAETDSFELNGTADISDDSAIYANPTNPELSVVVADDKDPSKGGVGVFDMKGALLQFRQDGMIGNIDLRSGFPLGGSSIVLVGANNRSDDSLIFWKLDPATRELSAPIGQAVSTISPSYGYCLYHSERSGKFYAFVTQENGKSTMEQYELGESAGKVSATKVRSFDVGSVTEGCVADDELGHLYVAQEDVALWKYGAEPSAGATRKEVGKVGDGHLSADLEGVSIAKGPGNTGYIVLSLQGQNRFAIYDRVSNAFIRDFAVPANGAIDAVSQTDGLDISTANLGPDFPKGALVVHDESNTGGTTSNLKFVPLK